jgi:hypothetical protein
MYFVTHYSCLRDKLIIQCSTTKVRLRQYSWLALSALDRRVAAD